MKKATFFQGVGFSLLSSVVALIVLLSMSSLFPFSNLIRFIVSGILFLYILYLFAKSEQKTGRLSLLLIFVVVTILSLMFVKSLILYVSLQLIMLWLIRSLYFYNSAFSSLTDLCLTGFSFLVAISVWNTSSSLFLTFWCFFLIQALFVFIPESINKKNKEYFRIQQNNSHFEQAYKSAEIAVRKLTTKY